MKKGEFIVGGHLYRWGTGWETLSLILPPMELQDGDAERSAAARGADRREPAMDETGNKDFKISAIPALERIATALENIADLYMRKG